MLTYQPNVEYVSEYTSSVSKKHTNKKQKKLKIQKQPKKEKRKKVLLLPTASVENLMGPDYIVCEFALCTFVIKL